MKAHMIIIGHNVSLLWE